MKKFSDMYDGLFSCTLGGETHIWVSREDVAQDLLCNHASISSARADLGAYPDVTKGFKYLPLIGYTHHLVRQRKFAHQIVGQSHRNGFYGYIGLEARRFLFELSRQPDGFADLINLFFARVSSRLAYGDAESAAFHVENAARFIHQLGPSGPVTNLLPFLGWLPEWLVRDIWDVRDRQEKEERMWKGLFNRTRQKEMVGKEGDSPPTYVKTALEMQEGKEGGKLLFENEEEAKFAVGMLCTVAIFTVQGPGVLFVMAMILHPEWQEKVRQEIDEVLGEEELVDLKHSPQLPTLRAAIKECIRWKSTVPLGMWKYISMCSESNANERQ